MWFYMDGSERRGPVSLEELRALASQGRIVGTTLVWSEGMDEWKQASQAIESFPQSAMAPPPPASPYGAQPSPYSPPVSLGASPAGDPGEPIPNFLPWSIAATVLCCMPAGVAAIIYSAKANTAKAAGNFNEARESANTAKIWLGVSVGIGVLVGILAIFAGLAENM